MPKGVKIERDEAGTGRIACRGDVVVVNLRIYSVREDSEARKKSAMRNCLVRSLSDQLRPEEIP